jgi:hypothetical protein
LRRHPLDRSGEVVVEDAEELVVGVRERDHVSDLGAAVAAAILVPETSQTRSAAAAAELVV